MFELTEWHEDQIFFVMDVMTCMNSDAYDTGLIFNIFFFTFLTKKCGPFSNCLFSNKGLFMKERSTNSSKNNNNNKVKQISCSAIKFQKYFNGNFPYCFLLRKKKFCKFSNEQYLFDEIKVVVSVRLLNTLMMDKRS